MYRKMNRLRVQQYMYKTWIRWAKPNIWWCVCVCWCVFCGNLFAIQRNRNFKQMNSFHWLTHRTKRRFQQINSLYWTRLSVHHIHIFTNTFYKYYIWIGSQHEFSLSLSKKIRFEQMEKQQHQQNHKTTKQKWNNF